MLIAKLGHLFPLKIWYILFSISHKMWAVLYVTWQAVFCRHVIHCVSKRAQFHKGRLLSLKCFWVLTIESCHTFVVRHESFHPNGRNPSFAVQSSSAQINQDVQKLLFFFYPPRITDSIQVCSLYRYISLALTTSTFSESATHSILSVIFTICTVCSL